MQNDAKIAARISIFRIALPLMHFVLPAANIYRSGLAWFGFVYLFLCLFVCLFVCFFVCLFVYLFACLLACLVACLFACLFACLVDCLLVCLFDCFLCLIFKRFGAFGRTVGPQRTCQSSMLWLSMKWGPPKGCRVCLQETAV